ncbi:ABC transporter substrate-binding protein [Bradyrhizobium sp. AUGA SZCCT0042]|uniref:ABC transporter substrate-binding protein n=1 Tax=Bradyrhizobium sp. AUGA SZCCT0042 TaxID=2807651 RepID=UPI001BAB239E|nr:ABC transporter substrate-binding protein [Bradyrhizobium sp. AUGA SZCCT0042]MBR1296064.1 ABC transporter substrate-binding protein [Bradyrhizobium sp. AUGA SZCCT0042]
MNKKPVIASDRRPSRRAVLTAGVSLGGGVLLGNWPLCATQAATSQPGPRVAALGWACAQTLLALGVVPLVVPEIERYGRLVVEPAVPSSVQEIGLRSEPNLELLQSFAPDIIIIDPSITAAIPRLKLIAPVEIFTIFRPGRHPLETARSSTMELAQRVGVQAACEAYLARFDAAMAGYREQLRNRGGKPLYLVSEIARNRALVFGPNSLYQEVLNQFGLKNAWTGQSGPWGHTSVGLEVLAAVPDARLILMSSRVADIEALLTSSPVLRTLPFLRSGRLTVLGNQFFYGGVPAAERFARLLAERLPQEKNEQG